MFETNEDLKKLFSSFKGLTTPAEMRSSLALENHALLVICTLDEAIVNLDDMDYVLDMLTKVGASHRAKLSDFDPDNFKVRTGRSGDAVYTVDGSNPLIYGALHL